jgi:hypothetical protein
MGIRVVLSFYRSALCIVINLLHPILKPLKRVVDMNVPKGGCPQVVSMVPKATKTTLDTGITHSLMAVTRGILPSGHSLYSRLQVYALGKGEIKYLFSRVLKYKKRPYYKKQRRGLILRCVASLKVTSESIIFSLQRQVYF